MAPGQPPGAGDQLDEQPRGGPAAHFMVLGAVPVPGLPGAVPGPLRRDARSDLGPCRARGEESLLLLLAEHPSDRRGARALLRGSRVPRVATGWALAHAACAEPRRGGRT